MSYLSIALHRQTVLRLLNQSDIARGAGLSRSYISRLFSGEAHELSDQNFTAILKIFSADQLAQARRRNRNSPITVAGAERNLTR